MEIKNKSEILNVAAEKASHELRASVKRMEGIVNVFNLEEDITDEEKKFLMKSITAESKQLDVYLTSIIDALNKRNEHAKI